MKSITKRDIILRLIKEFRGRVHNIHIFNIVSLFIEEMIVEIGKGETILIPNFLMVRLEEVGGKLIRNVRTGKMERSKKKRKLVLRLSRQLGKAISEEIEKDIEQ